MNKLRSYISKAISILFSTKAAGFYLLTFASAIGIATFIENDYGTSAAQKVIFKSAWFELLLVLFAGTILVNIIKFRMIQQKKWALLLFHSAMIIILIGAGVTRYWGFEGIMHIRENEASNKFLSSDAHLKFKVEKAGQVYEFDEAVLFASLGNNKWNQSYLIKDDLIEIRVKDFIPNPTKEMVVSIQGKPTLKLVVAGPNGREEYFISMGETKRIRNLIYNFNEAAVAGAINIIMENGNLFMNTDRVLIRTVMATQKTDTIFPDASNTPLALRALHRDGPNNFVFSEYKPNAVVQMTSEDPKVKNESVTSLLMEVSVNNDSREFYLYGNKGYEGRPETLQFKDLSITASYGAKVVEVPFYIRLNKFIMEKYPGTNSASSYASEVTVLDKPNEVSMDYRIFMNNILDYQGYRFFQSSFDKDEKGTYLSVNNDFWGTWISYVGYALLTLGMIMTLFSKKTRFYDLSQKIGKLRKKGLTSIVLLCSLTATSVQAQSTLLENGPELTVDADHAKQFSELAVQDFKGRMKPIHTLSREVMRKLARKESLHGLNADQILLGMFANNSDWYHVAVVKLGDHKEIHRMLSVAGDYAAYADFFAQDGSYKLRDEVRRIYSLEPIDRGVLEKELLKIDERVNIMSMVFSGTLLKMVPIPNDPNNTWESTHGHNHVHTEGEVPGIAEGFFTNYQAALREAMNSKDYKQANHLLAELKDYQVKNGGEVVPTNAEIKSEIFLNKLNVFNRLAGLYALLGIGFLFFLFVSVFKPKMNLNKAYLVLFGLVLAGFLFHTLGLGLRWYVSGRAPWSNGYESMIYIAWTSTLAGILFTRRSFGGLAATMVLASTILLVSTLSFLDPEITPLVPVLKSYWLTIHVSLEAGSYGFLMLGAIIGLINLILMVFLKETNKTRIKNIITEMSYISEMTLIGGLFMVSVGTYLGGVWANESWGRYWGWDAKETWALVTILVYAFILHMRLIPKLRGLFAFNVATIFGLASVIMTYYGVNYYLSGLHSYATGDPVPIPNWVYIVVLSILAISAMAYYKRRKIPGIS